MSHHQGVGRRQVRVAAALMIAQGALMEGLPFLALPVLLMMNVHASVLAQGFSFIVPFFNAHLYLMMAMSGIFGSLRVVAAIGLLRNRLWGYWLGTINCLVTLVVMTFMLPAGIVDGLLSGAALFFLLLARYGETPIHRDGQPVPCPESKSRPGRSPHARIDGTCRRGR